MSGPSVKGVEVFCCYAHEDEHLLHRLETHLSSLKREGFIKLWYDRQIIAGTEWATEVDRHLDNASIILLLISADFIASDYCYGVEMERAMERHHMGQAHVIPIILRPVDWEHTPFAKLHALPEDGKPVTKWNDMEEAFVNIAAGMRQVVKKLLDPALSPSRTKIVHTPPGISLAHFQDREEKIKEIASFLSDAATCMLFVRGRNGIGKTALVLRALKSLEDGHLYHENELITADAIIYKNAYKTEPLTASGIYHDLCSLLPAPASEVQRKKWNVPGKPVKDKVDELLQYIPSRRYVLLLNDFEHMIEFTTKNLIDTELLDVLYALLHFTDEHDPHPVKVIIISTEPVPQLQRDTQAIEHISTLLVDDGLVAPYAENYLKALDKTGTAGLRDAPASLLTKAQELTQGYPRALLALYQVLNSEEGVTLEDLLNGMKSEDVDFIMAALVEKAFKQLEPAAQKVMQALAIYGQAVSAAAVVYLLQPYNVEGGPVLDRLVESAFVQKVDTLYSLHQTDQRYAFSLIEVGRPEDRFASENPRFTRFALVCRGVEYFRYVEQNYEAAAYLLLTIDALLLRYGEHQFLRDQYGTFQEKLQNPGLRMTILNNLGTACLEAEDYQKAIESYTQSTQIAREIGNRGMEAAGLYNLAICYESVGKIDWAIQNAQQVLAIARVERMPHLQWAALVVLGISYSRQGQTEEAIRQYEQARDVTDKMRDAIKMADVHLSLGNSYARQGKIALARASYKEVIDIYDRQESAVQQRMKLLRGTTDHSLAEIAIDEEKYDAARAWANEGIAIGIEMKNMKLGIENNSVLALAHLYSGQLSAAREAIERAQQCNVRMYNHYVAALLGMIALRQGDREVAQAAFERASSYAAGLVAHDSSDYQAWDIQFLALCGLALCGKNASLSVAIDAYAMARAITKDAGVVRRISRLFEELRKADTEQVLVEVQKQVIEPS